MSTGPLRGVRVIELAGIGPVPFCGMVLSDLGADVVRVDRIADATTADRSKPRGNALDRGRRSIAIDLKHAEGAALVRRLAAGSGALIEGWRPGVAERLGVGPDECRIANPKLVYGRMTGWGREGPLADRAGHDIDYIAVAGALDAFGRAGQPPTPPLNVVGDFGGGGLLLALGVVAALFEVANGGEGQVVDTAMVDGTAMLLAPFYAARQLGLWGERGTNMLDTGAPFYDVYACADGQYVAVGALEPQFYAALLGGLELRADDVPDRDDPAQWPDLRAVLSEQFARRTRDEWAEVFADLDACVAPVLGLGEAPTHPHNVARSTFVEVGGVVQPAPAPRFSATPGGITHLPCHAGEHTAEVLAEFGIATDEVSALTAAGVIF